MSNSADDVSRRMQEVRRNVGDEVETIVQSAKTLSDWRHYVKNHPWLCVGAATAVGFLLVPRRRRQTTEASDQTKELVEMLKKHDLGGAAARGSSSGIVNTLIGVATPFLVRTALSVVQNRLASTDFSSLFGGRGAGVEDDGGAEPEFEDFNIPR